MDYPPSAYTLDGMTEIDNSPITIYLRFYWNGGAHRTHSELTDFLTEHVYSDFDKLDMPRYARYLREVFDQAIYIDCQELNPYNTYSLGEAFEFDAVTNTLKIEFTHSRIPRGWDRNEIVWCFNEMKEMLPDTLWESEPGSGFVHESGAVVDYDII